MLGLPFVTCLCLTRNRRPWLRKAIRYFQEQTYPTKELLIVADGEDVRDLVPEAPNIRLIHIEENYLIGQKRNFGASRARGEIIAHWDDDDYSAPGRLADQVRRLLDSGKSVTGYSSMLFTDGSRWWRFRGAPSHGMGTSLCFYKKWWVAHPFPMVQCGEDGFFVMAAFKAHEFISEDAGELMVASCHSQNTSQRQLRSDAYHPLPDFPGVSWSEPLCV